MNWRSSQVIKKIQLQFLLKFHWINRLMQKKWICVQHEVIWSSLFIYSIKFYIFFHLGPTYFLLAYAVIVLIRDYNHFTYYNLNWFGLDYNDTIDFYLKEKRISVFTAIGNYFQFLFCTIFFSDPDFLFICFSFSFMLSQEKFLIFLS